MSTPGAGARTVAVVTAGRADYGAYRPILRAIEAEPSLRLHLIAAGAHLCARFGHTLDEIEADGFAVKDRVDLLLASDGPEGVAGSMGLGTMRFAEAYGRLRPDWLLVLGDRFEMHAAVVAAVPFTIPVAHIHGGETTAGAIDDALRHSITKLSHLHFVATEAYGRRVIALGEEPWRVTVSGAPSLDNLATIKRVPRQELERRLGMPLPEGLLLVTYHPVTMEFEETARQIEELLAALEASGRPVLLTLPNADTNGSVIRRRLDEFAARVPRIRVVASLGTEAYFSLMAIAAAMVGNSSSGLIEAPSFGLPVVNIGSRQDGRLRAGNVIDVGDTRDRILEGIRRAAQPAFRARLQGMANPYGDGLAAERIVNRLKKTALDDRLLRKGSVRPSGGAPRPRGPQPRRRAVAA